MGDMPTRQKILLIILAVVAAVYLYQMIGGSEDPAVQGPQPISAPSEQAQIPVTNQQTTQQTAQSNAGFGQRRPTGTMGRQPAEAGAQTQSGLLPEIELEWRSDPFFREKTVVVVSETPEGELLKDLIYGGSSITSRAKYAFINGKLYKINDEIGGFKILEIHSDHVILIDKNNKRYTLR